jgi:hypothetical protein
VEVGDVETIALQNQGEKCLVCEEINLAGIHIFNHFICQTCEQKIVSTETNEDQYRFYLKRLRKLNKVER